MNLIIQFFLAFTMINNSLVFDFNTNSKISNWFILDDIVMGGESLGKFILNKNGHGEFYGKVSLKNSGGFSSVRYRLQKDDFEPYSKFKIKIKGDGKKYQFRVKTNQYDYHSYIFIFQTTGDWQTIEIPFKDMKPVFRGRMLDMKNYQGKELQELAFLIGNKKNESFRLEIDKIEIAK